MLPGHLLNIDTFPFASGGFGDVYRGTLDGSNVCVKRVRVYIKDGPEKVAKVRCQSIRSPYLPFLKKVQAFCREAVMWKRLMHPNILPLLGITIGPLQLISSWMSGGDLPEHIKNNANADRPRLVGV
jgi:serine/threonine protein kinase